MKIGDWRKLHNEKRHDFYSLLHVICGPGSSIGIETDYGLDGPGVECRWGEIFRMPRPALRPTQWVPALSRGKVRPGLAADHSPASSAAVMEE